MHNSIDLPDELFCRAKAAAVFRGQKFKELIEEGLLLVLESPYSSSNKRRAKKTLFELMEAVCGIGNSGVDDLASNPKHMKTFGS
jgi:hypothetical protein